MEQHPVPQQISSYQFRLVGDMTLKQFFQLAGGALIALMFYASPLPNIFKWPLVVFFALAGAAFAFLPFEERPLEVWVFAFFRSIYSPTLFYWKKYDKPPQYFLPDAQSPSTAGLPEPVANVPSTTSTPADAAILTKLETDESNFMSKIGTLFKGPHPAPATNSTPVMTTTVTPAPATLKESFPVGKPSQEIYQAPTKPVVAPPMPVAQIQPVTPTLQNQNTQGTVAQFSVDAAPPHPPEQPNIIVGQVMDAEGKIIEGAILEVRDEQGRSVRALKTNKAGHFLIVTPLANGKYQLVTEKPDYTFSPITFEASGSIIPAIAIKANNQ